MERSWRGEYPRHNADNQPTPDTGDLSLPFIPQAGAYVTEPTPSGSLRQSPSERRRLFDFLLIYSTVIVDFMGYTLLAPLGYYFLLYFNVTSMSSGTGNSLLMSSYGAGLFISSLILGSMSDTYGRARVILWALSGTAAAYFGQAMAWSFFVLVFFRFIGGLFSGTRPVLLAYLADTVTPTAMPFYSSLIGLCVAASQCLAGGAGGVLATISLQTPLWVACIVTASVALLAGLWLQEPLPDASSSVVVHRRHNRTYESSESLDLYQVPTTLVVSAAATCRPTPPGMIQQQPPGVSTLSKTDEYMKSYEWWSVLVCSIILGATIQFNFSSWITLLPLICAITWDLAPDTTGYILASQGLVTIVANLFVFIPLTKWLNIATVASLGCFSHSLIIGVAYLQQHSIGPTVVLGYCLSLGNTLALASLPVVSKIIAPNHKRGYVNAMVMSTQNLSMVIGPLLGGYMLDVDPSHRLPFIVMSINGIIGLLAGVFIRINIGKIEASLKRLQG